MDLCVTQLACLHNGGDRHSGHQDLYTAVAHGRPAGGFTLVGETVHLEVVPVLVFLTISADRAPVDPDVC